MYSVDLWRKHNFCLLKIYVNFLSRSTFSSNDNVSCSNSAFLWLDFQKTKSDAPVLIKLCLPFTSVNLISFTRVFIPFLSCHGLWNFFEMFVFVCFLLLLLLLSLFSLVFISGQNFISSSKDVAASRAVVELIIRTVTLTIVYYSRELAVQ